MENTKTLSRTFKAVADDGREYEIFVDHTVISGSGLPAGLPRMRTSDGRKVTNVGYGEYEIAGLNAIRLRLPDSGG
jgi:hypothetical protein